MQLRKKNLKKIRLVWIRTLTPGVPVQRCNQLSWSFNVIYEIHVFIISLKQRLSRLSVFFFLSGAVLLYRTHLNTKQSLSF